MWVLIWKNLLKDSLPSKGNTTSHKKPLLRLEEITIKLKKILINLENFLNFLSYHQKDSKLYLSQLGLWQKQLGILKEKSMTFAHKIATCQGKTF